MDGTRFDRMTRAFARVGTRRQVVAGVVAGATAIAAPELAGATRSACRAAGQGCTRHTQCCTGICRTGRHLPRRERNRCACPEGLVGCGSGCTDLAADVENCGACGHACADGGVCVSGYCDYPNACPEAWQADTWYCVTSTEGKAFIDGDESSLTKLAGSGSDAANCAASSDCDRFAICRDSGVECACGTGDWWDASTIDRWDSPSCVADIKQFLCSGTTTTPGFAVCYETVEREAWGAFVADSRDELGWVCQSSDQCDGDWDPLCDDPDFRCSCVYATAPAAGGSSLTGSSPMCIRRRVRES